MGTDIYSPETIDNFILNAWKNRPPHYGGKFPRLEDKAQALATKVSRDFFQMPAPVFVRVRDTKKCRARYTYKPPRSYVTMSKRSFHYPDCQDGTPPWTLILLHELCHIECYRWYRGEGEANGHGDIFQTIERQVLNARGYDPEYTRTPGYWRRLYESVTGDLIWDRIADGWFKV